MMDKANKSAPIVLTDEGATEGKGKTTAIKHSTIPDWVIALKYCLEQSKKGLVVTNNKFSRLPFGNHYFRNHFSVRGELRKLGIAYGKKWFTCPKSKKRYKVYFILRESFSKAEEIVKRYYRAGG